VTGNRPSQFDDRKRRTYSAEDLNFHRIAPLNNNGSNFQFEATSQLEFYNSLDDDEEPVDIEKVEEQDKLELKRVGILNSLKMNIFLF